MFSAFLFLLLPSSACVQDCSQLMQQCLQFKPIMSFARELWIKKIPELSDADITNLQQALDKEKGQRRDRRIFQLFRKKCMFDTPAGITGDTFRAGERTRRSVLAALQVPHKAATTNRVVDSEAVSGSDSRCGRDDSDISA